MNRIKSALLFSGIVALTVSLSTCSRLRDDEPKGQGRQLAPVIKEYFGSYNKDSWWEYEIKDSGTTELISLTKSPIGRNLSSNSEDLIYLLYSNHREPLIIRANADDANVVQASVYNSTLVHYIWANANGDSLVSHDTSYHSVSYLDSVEINGYRFKKVLVSKQLQVGDITEIWVAPNFGIIKKVYGNAVYLIKNAEIK